MLGCRLMGAVPAEAGAVLAEAGAVGLAAAEAGPPDLAPLAVLLAAGGGAVAWWLPGESVRFWSEVAVNTVSSVPVIRARIRQQASRGNTMLSLASEPRTL